jgi:hypothetical protein
MTAETTNEMIEILEVFMASGDFKAGCISATKASWSGSGYSVELFQDGTWRVLWNNEIGNLYKTPGVILGLPTPDDADLQEYLDKDGINGEAGYFDLAWSNEEETLKKELRTKLSDED